MAECVLICFSCVENSYNPKVRGCFPGIIDKNPDRLIQGEPGRAAIRRDAVRGTAIYHVVSVM